MKIIKQLKINFADVVAISDHYRFEMMTPARCVLTVKANIAPMMGQLIEFNAKLDNNDLRRVFYGFIETVTPQQSGVYKIIGREFTALLNQRINLNLRHPAPADVLKVISDKTNLQFVLPASDWTKKTVSRFQHIGGGYMALDSILRLWDVERGFWTQQGDGQIYIGEFSKSLAGDKVIEIRESYFENIGVQGGTLPIIPRLRPSVKIKISGREMYINSIDIQGDDMRLNWLADPWDKKLKAIQ